MWLLVVRIQEGTFARNNNLPRRCSINYSLMKLMVMKKLLSATTVLVCLCAGFLSSCKRKHDTIAVDPAVKDAFLFRVGSYWIYRDTVNGTVDSVVVDRVDSSYVSEGDYPADHVETIDMHGSIYRQKGGNYVYRNDRLSGLRKGRVEDFIFPFTGSGTRVVTLLPNTIILGNTLQNVTQIANGTIDTYLVKENVGVVFIRRRLSDSQNYFYGLERWHVVQ